MERYSKIIAGTMGWGSWGKSLNTKEMVVLMNHFIEQGVSSFDHADIYGAHSTEEEFGKAFSESSISRERIQLITKCGIQYMSEKRSFEIKHYDYSQKHIIWSVEQSLKNFQTDYVDLLLLHRPSPLMRAEEIAEAVEKLRNQGKIKDFGLSNFNTSQTQLIQKSIDVDVNQIQFSLSSHEAMLDGNLDFMQLNGIKPMAWNPLGNVFQLENEQTIRIRKQLSELELKYDASGNQLLLAWLLQHPANISPVIGTTNLERISNSVEAGHLQLDLQDWFKLWVGAMGNKVP